MSETRGIGFGDFIAVVLWSVSLSAIAVFWLLHFAISGCNADLHGARTASDSVRVLRTSCMIQ